eukprot:1562353-Pyramimonas_sp.AAC.1
MAQGAGCFHIFQHKSNTFRHGAACHAAVRRSSARPAAWQPHRPHIATIDHGTFNFTPKITVARQIIFNILVGQKD